MSVDDVKMCSSNCSAEMTKNGLGEVSSSLTITTSLLNKQRKTLKDLNCLSVARFSFCWLCLKTFITLETESQFWFNDHNFFVDLWELVTRVELFK